MVDTKNITKLDGLDLASLLRVFDRNWFVITSTWFVNSKYRQQVKEMMAIRNFWAHLSSEDLSKEKVIGDVEVIIDLMSAFDAKTEDTRDMEQFIMDVESDKDIQDKPVTTTVSSSHENEQNSTSMEITNGSMITLVSDPSKAGAQGKYRQVRYRR